MVEASCHCGSIRLEIDAPPSEVTAGNCSICRRYGVLWAYYSPDQVCVLPPDPPTDVYAWDDRSIEFRRCQNCGCVSHWAAMDRERALTCLDRTPSCSWPKPPGVVGVALGVQGLTGGRSGSPVPGLCHVPMV